MAYRLTLLGTQASIQLTGLVTTALIGAADVSATTVASFAGRLPTPTLTYLRALQAGDAFQMHANVTDGTNYHNFDYYQGAPLTNLQVVASLPGGVPTATFQGVTFAVLPGNVVLNVVAPVDLPGTLLIMKAWVDLHAKNQSFNGSAFVTGSFPSWAGAGPYFTTTISGSSLTFTLGSMWSVSNFNYNNANGPVGTAGSFMAIWGNNNGQPVSGLVSMTGCADGYNAGSAVFGATADMPTVGSAAIAELIGQLYDFNFNPIQPGDKSVHCDYTVKLFEVTKSDDLKRTITAKGQINKGDKDADDMNPPPPLASFRVDNVYGIDSATGAALPNPYNDKDPLNTGDNFYGCRHRNKDNFYPGEGRRYIAMALKPQKYASGVIRVKYHGTLSNAILLEMMTPNGAQALEGSWPPADETLQSMEYIYEGGDYARLAYGIQVEGHGTIIIDIPFTITVV